MDPDFSKKRKKKLMRLQQSLQCKLEIDASRLVLLANTLETSKISKDLKVGLGIVKWWKYIVEDDLEMLEEEMKIKDVEINKLDGVINSIKGMKERMQDSVDLLTRSLHIIERPEPLLCICLQKVEEKKLNLENLPVTLQNQAWCWRDTKEERNRDNMKLLARVVHKISHILGYNLKNL